MPPRRSPTESHALRAELVQHARRLTQRDGPHALTMRALAEEAGCAVGLPYTVFTNRDDLVAELVRVEIERLVDELDRWAADAGSRTVGVNLVRYAHILLDNRDAPAFALADEIHDDTFRASVAQSADTSGLLRSFGTAVATYLGAEQRIGRVSPDVDVAAYGFFVTGAVHNLLASGPAFPRPNDRTLHRFLTTLSRDIGTRPPD
jgi:AcrR family transcriptional regulator